MKKLAVGDRIVVEAGRRVPADGLVLRGMALVDEKALTGESVPREKRAGDRVLAATVIVEGQLVVGVERAGSDTTAMKIVQILEGAGAKPMTLQRETERVADRLVLPTFAVAGRRRAALVADRPDGERPHHRLRHGHPHRGAHRGAHRHDRRRARGCARQGRAVPRAAHQGRRHRLRQDRHAHRRRAARSSRSSPFGSARRRGTWPWPPPPRRARATPSRRPSGRSAASASLDVPCADLGSEEYSIGLGLSARVTGREVLVGGKRLMMQHGVRIAHARATAERHREMGAASLYVAVDGTLGPCSAWPTSPGPRAARSSRARGRRPSRGPAAVGRLARPRRGRGPRVGVDRAIGELLPEEKARVREGPPARRQDCRDGGRRHQRRARAGRRRRGHLARGRHRRRARDRRRGAPRGRASRGSRTRS